LKTLKAFTGSGYPNGKFSGEVLKVQTLTLGTNERLFESRLAGKILAIEKAIAIGGEGFKIVGTLVYRRSSKIPKALILRRHNEELLTGLIAASCMENSGFFYVWNVSSGFFEEIETGDSLDVTIAGGKATISKV
jgi:predicted aconitase with swiveling domain